MKKQLYIAIGVVIVAIVLLYMFLGEESGTSETITVKVKSGEFKIAVTTTGELEAKSSENIYGPQGLNQIRIWGDMKILDLIPEGTVVDSGDYVASIDKTIVDTKLKDVESEIEKFESQITKTKLDTTLELRAARDQLVNLEFEMEQRKIVLDQSKFEPPATIRQAEIDLEKSERSYEQALDNYKLKQRKAIAQVREVQIDYEKSLRSREMINKILNQFNVVAPKSGMVIYYRSWRGKRKTGSTIDTWDNIVAQLPDLSEMIIKTYVNEIDISKVKEGQHVQISVDAFPDIHYEGTVTEVANMGEEKQNSNAKVYEVKLNMQEPDSILRPAMTTKNTIITEIIEDCLFVPIDCIQNNDSVSYVYTSNSRQEVILGKRNDDEIIVIDGLDMDDEIYLVPPENAENYRFRYLEKKTDLSLKNE